MAPISLVDRTEIDIIAARRNSTQVLLITGDVLRHKSENTVASSVMKLRLFLLNTVAKVCLVFYRAYVSIRNFTALRYLTEELSHD